MDNLAFLVLAVIVSIVGSLYLVLRRRSPESPHSSIEAFTDRMSALDPSSEDRVAPVIAEEQPDTSPETSSEDSGHDPGLGTNVATGDDDG